MAKSHDRRAALLGVMTDHILSYGLASASLAQLAQAANTSDRMLIYYFKTKSEIISAVLGCIAHRLAEELGERITQTRRPLAVLRVELTEILLADDLWPYMQIWLDIVAHAARGDQFYQDMGGQIARGFLDWGALQLDSQNCDADAAALLIWIEGCVVLKSVGLKDVYQAAV